MFTAQTLPSIRPTRRQQQRHRQRVRVDAPVGPCRRTLHALVALAPAALLAAALVLPSWYQLEGIKSLGPPTDSGQTVWATDVRIGNFEVCVDLDPRGLGPRAGVCIALRHPRSNASAASTAAAALLGYGDGHRACDDPSAAIWVECRIANMLQELCGGLGTWLIALQCLGVVTGALSAAMLLLGPCLAPENRRCAVLASFASQLISSMAITINYALWHFELEWFSMGTARKLNLVAIVLSLVAVKILASDVRAVTLGAYRKLLQTTRHGP